MVLSFFSVRLKLFPNKNFKVAIANDAHPLVPLQESCIPILFLFLHRDGAKDKNLAWKKILRFGWLDVHKETHIPTLPNALKGPLQLIPKHVVRIIIPISMALLLSTGREISRTDPEVLVAVALKHGSI